MLLFITNHCFVCQPGLECTALSAATVSLTGLAERVEDHQPCMETQHSGVFRGQKSIATVWVGASKSILYTEVSLIRGSTVCTFAGSS